MGRKSSLNTLSSLFLYLFFLVLIWGFTLSFYSEEGAWHQGLPQGGEGHEEGGAFPRGDAKRELFHVGEAFEYEVLSKAYRRHITFEVLSRLEEGYLLGAQRVEERRISASPFAPSQRVSRVVEDRFSVGWEGEPRRKTLSSLFWKPLSTCPPAREGEVTFLEGGEVPGTWKAWVCTVTDGAEPVGEAWIGKERGVLLRYEGIFLPTGEEISLVLRSHREGKKHHLFNVSFGNTTLVITK
jgi:hypothetical protein